MYSALYFFYCAILLLLVVKILYEYCGFFVLRADCQTKYGI